MESKLQPKSLHLTRITLEFLHFLFGLLVGLSVMTGWVPLQF